MLFFFIYIYIYKKTYDRSWLSDGSLGSLHRWRSQRIAKCQSCELQDTMAHFELRNTLLTERISHFADIPLWLLQCAWLSVRSFFPFIYIYISIYYIYKGNIHRYCDNIPLLSLHHIRPILLSWLFLLDRKRVICFETFIKVHITKTCFFVLVMLIAFAVYQFI